MKIIFQKTVLLLSVVTVLFFAGTGIGLGKNDKDKASPVISDVASSLIATDSATITWTTDEPADSDIDYGIDHLSQHGPADSTLVTSHSILLTGLTDNSTYSYCVKSTDDNNNKAKECEFTFTTEAMPPSDQTPPAISNIGAESITVNSATIVWTTDEIANSQVEYGTTESYGMITTLDATLNINHVVTLSGLAANTVYHFRILSADGSDNKITSADYQFSTLAGSNGGGPPPDDDTFVIPPATGGGTDPAPTISNVTARVLNQKTVTIEWTTDELATSQIDYGFTSSYGESTRKDSVLTQKHKQAINGLIQNTTYHFRVVSVDNRGNTSYSIDTIFTTGGLTNGEPPAPIDDLGIHSVEQTSLVLSWSTPASESGVIFYDINRSDEIITEENFKDPKIVHQAVVTVENVEKRGIKHSYRAIGLNPGAKVYFAVKSADPFGNVSLISNVVEAVTLSIPSSPGIFIAPPEDKTSPRPVDNVQAFALDRLITLLWENPGDKDFAGTKVVRSTTGYPQNPSLGETIYDGSAITFSDPNLDNGKTYYYSLFSYDHVFNYSKPIQLSLAPYAERRHYHILKVQPGESNPSLPITKDFMFGDTDEEIGHIQGVLAQDPTLYPEGLVTGYFGPLTQSAVKRLQTKNNVPVTGVIDAVVRSILKKLPINQLTITPAIIKALSSDLFFTMRGENVRILQTHLQEQGFLAKEVIINGYFGLQTRQAVIDFQKAHNITPAIGYVGPITRAKIIEKVQAVVRLKTPEVQTVAENLTIPWEVIFLDDETILVTERPGTLAVIKDGITQKITVEGVYSIGEGGLLGAALHPDFSKNNFLYLYFTYLDSEVKNKVMRYEFKDGALFNPKIIIDSIPGLANHNGGRIAFGPDGYLYITTGYADADTLSQDTSSLAGKILRLKDDGTTPSANPFNNAVYSYGHRNIQGLAWDDKGNLWATEHGSSGTESGYDEINLIEKGANYGWPVIQGDQTKPDMASPMLTSQPDIWAPAGMVFSAGSLFFGGLRGETLYEARLYNGNIVNLKEHFSKKYGRIRTVVKGPDGNIYFTTSNTDGRGNLREHDDKLIKVTF